MTQARLKKVPKFASIPEEAEFWDTHDLTDYFDFSKRVTNIVFKIKKDKGVTVRFRQDDLESLRKMADAKGLGVTTYIRMAAMEKLRVTELPN